MFEPNFQNMVKNCVYPKYCKKIDPIKMGIGDSMLCTPYPAQTTLSVT